MSLPLQSFLKIVGPLSAVASVWLTVQISATQPASYQSELPAQSLKLSAGKSGVLVLSSLSKGTEIRAHPGSGFTAWEALDRTHSETSLMVKEDEKNGTTAVPPANGSNDPSAAPDSDNEMTSTRATLNT